MGANERRSQETRDGEEREETANPDPAIFQAAAVAGLGVAARYAMRSTALSLSPLAASLLSPLAGAAVAGLGVAGWNAMGSTASSSSPSLGFAAWNAMRSTASSSSLAAWNAMRSMASSSSLAAWNAMRSMASSPSPSPLDESYQERTYHQKRTFRFNVGASQDPYATNKAGIGGVLRNENGEILHTFSESMELNADITAAELTAIKGALEVFSINKFDWVGLYDELIVANDNETAVRLAKGEDQSLLLPLLDDIQTLVSAIGDVDFIKVDKDDIRDAHELANEGRNKNF